jgi:hypothetical protein
MAEKLMDALRTIAARPRESGDPGGKKRKNWMLAYAGMSGVCG